MLSAINTYNNIDGLHGLRSTPQYGFNRGMKEFGQAGYDATVLELSDNLIGMDAVKMLGKSRITSDVFMNALSYLMFLKRKRIERMRRRATAARIYNKRRIKFTNRVHLRTIHIVRYGRNGRQAGSHM